MDLSKLPRLSKTEAGANALPDATESPPAAPSPAQPAPATTFCVRCAAPLRPGAKFCDSCGAPAGVDYTTPALRVDPDLGVGIEVWISAIIGIVLMLVGRSFASYLAATLTGQSFHTNVNWIEGPKEGQEVGYWELTGYTALSDSAIFLFGLTMVVESVVLAIMNTRFKAKSQLVAVALFFTALVTLYNALAALMLLTAGVAPYSSLLAVAFGGYIAVFEWRLLQQLRAARQR
jgi:hypothetical protein